MTPAQPPQTPTAAHPGDVRVVSLKPGDVVVVETDHPLSLHARAWLMDELSRVWPGHKVLVCEPGIRIKAVSPEALGPPAGDPRLAPGGRE